ncbi:T9SS type A sorting domain-containing protein [Flavobacterium sp.]|uniref:DUF7619 domain-containing protein n=1 Tax=Flavobacterium sp. TaxID=239 RepID=UPI00286C63B7|nr:T9SS type A sorting domain-containing protein [Flavobacterium sp.]
MKNIFLLFLLFTGMVKAQIVNIPDANFKAILLSANMSNIIAYNTEIDINHNGEIEYSEAQNVLYLNLDTSSSTDNIADLTGIETFVNLIDLNFSDNQLTTFDPNCLLGMTSLQKLNCNNCQLNQLYVNNLYQLTQLGFRQNNITTIDVSNLTNLTDFASASNPLLSLNINNLVNLTSLKCYSNNLTSLDLSYFPNLAVLQCDANPLNALNLEVLNLSILSCSSTNITSLDISNCTALYNLKCSYNALTSLDVSHNINLQNLDCSNNQLTTLYLKNGINETTLHFDNNLNLSFICVDEGQVAAVQNELNALGMNATVCNSYCSFTPGGDYNAIAGTIIFDSNNNGCDAADDIQPNIRVNINDGITTGATFLNAAGNYSFYTQAGSFEITPAVENPTWFNFSPTTVTIPFADNNNNSAVQDFCIVANGVHPDIEMVISPVTPARPGFDAVYRLVYRNKGNQTVDAYLNFNYNDAVLDLVSTTVVPFLTSPGSVSFHMDAVQPFQNGSVDITLHVNAPTDTAPVNVGDILTFTSFVDITTIDDNWADNAFTFHQTVVGSFDPNDITCLEGDVAPVAAIGDYLHYAINFENTGTFPAEDIVVKTEIDPAKFDINSLQMMYANFPVYARIIGNKIEFIFKNINLEIGGHGHILLKIKTQNTLVTGDEVANRADIFFDYNAPIDTGLVNTVFQTLSNTDFETDNSVTIAPNPVSNEVIVKADNSIKSIQLYDSQGRIILTHLIDDLVSKIDLSSYSKGIYFIKITTKKGAQVEKLLKD